MATGELKGIILGYMSVGVGRRGLRAGDLRQGAPSFTPYHKRHTLDQVYMQPRLDPPHQAALQEASLGHVFFSSADFWMEGLGRTRPGVIHTGHTYDQLEVASYVTVAQGKKSFVVGLAPLLPKEHGSCSVQPLCCSGVQRPLPKGFAYMDRGQALFRAEGSTQCGEP